MGSAAQQRLRAQWASQCRDGNAPLLQNTLNVLPAMLVQELGTAACGVGGRGGSLSLRQEDKRAKRLFAGDPTHQSSIQPTTCHAVLP